MTGKREEIDTRVRAKAGQGEFLGQLLAFSRGQSADVHEDFIRELSALATALREMFDREGLVQRFPRPATDFWASARIKGIVEGPALGAVQLVNQCRFCGEQLA